jgi:hypothetical protein
MDAEDINLYDFISDDEIELLNKEYDDYCKFLDTIIYEDNCYDPYDEY